MAGRITRGNGDRFGFVSYWGIVSLEDGDEISDEDFPMNGINLEDVNFDTDMSDAYGDDDDDMLYYDVAVSAPYTYGGMDIADILNGVSGMVAENEFEPLDMPDDYGPRIFVCFNGGSALNADADVVSDWMEERGYTDDDIVSINGIPWPFDGYRR